MRGAPGDVPHSELVKASHPRSDRVTEARCLASRVGAEFRPPVEPTFLRRVPPCQEESIVFVRQMTMKRRPQDVV